MSRRPMSWRRFLVVVIVLVVAGGATAAGQALTTDSTDQYRTARAALGTVTETLTGSGTIDSAQRHDIATAVEGTVDKVAVNTGDTVKTGDLLISLDRDAAQRAVRKAEADLAQAKADLERAETPQEEAVQAAAQPASYNTQPAETDTADSVQPTAETSRNTNQPGSGDSASPPKDDVPSLSKLSTLQGAVKEAQTATSTALEDASTALDAQTEACAKAYGRDTTRADGDSGDSGQRDTACDEALAAVQEAQQAVAKKQKQLKSAIDDLTGALVAATSQTSAAAKALQQWADQQAREDKDEQPRESTGKTTPNTRAPSGSTAGAPAGGTGADGPSGSGGDSGAPDSPGANAASAALSVAEAQASVDEARADLTRARQNLDATRITARTNGTVSAVEVAENASVAVGDTVVTVVGEDGATVSMTLTTAQVGKVDTGQAADVSIPGATGTATGEVVWVSPVASASDGSAPAFARSSSYAAEVFVPASELADEVLPQGARAEVTITVGSSEDAVTVPTSALKPTARGTTVQVLGADGPQSKTVEVGRTGPSRAEIVIGVAAGDKVVLADLDAEIDAAGEVADTSTSFGPGRRGLPGGGRRPTR